MVVDREMLYPLPAHMPCCEELVKSFHLSAPSEPASAAENHLAQDDT